MWPIQKLWIVPRGKSTRKSIRKSCHTSCARMDANLYRRYFWWFVSSVWLSNQLQMVLKGCFYSPFNRSWLTLLTCRIHSMSWTWTVISFIATLTPQDASYCIQSSCILVMTETIENAYQIRCFSTVFLLILCSCHLNELRTPWQIDMGPKSIYKHRLVGCFDYFVSKLSIQERFCFIH